MRTALICTTIHVPSVLALYRAHDPDVRFFVSGDVKTSNEAVAFCAGLGNCIFITHDANLNREYKCESLIGKNTISRRNIALLEALKWGAELIVSIDDDNIPLGAAYFDCYRFSFSGNYAGLKAQPFGNWFDPGRLSFPRDRSGVSQRGFPSQCWTGSPRITSVVGAKIGVAQGTILFDPDTSAVDRISQHPEVHQVSELLRAGIVTDPCECYAPINTQNLAFVRELAPCFLMVPFYKRFDDIFGGFVAQRIMREHGYHVHFGQPFAAQERNAHDLLKDLEAELWGMQHTLEFAAWLDGFLGQTSVIGMLRVMATNLPKFIPTSVQELWLAWLQDCEQVL
jgi:hypothetical protein